MDGDISALNPITDAPTTMAPTTMSPTLPPFPTLPMTTAAAPVDKKRQIILYGVAGAVALAAIVIAWKKGMFKKLLK